MEYVSFSGLVLALSKKNCTVNFCLLHRESSLERAFVLWHQLGHFSCDGLTNKCPLLVGFSSDTQKQRDIINCNTIR